MALGSPSLGRWGASRGCSGRSLGFRGAGTWRHTRPLPPSRRTPDPRLPPRPPAGPPGPAASWGAWRAPSSGGSCRCRSSGRRCSTGTSCSARRVAWPARGPERGARLPPPPAPRRALPCERRGVFLLEKWSLLAEATALARASLLGSLAEGGGQQAGWGGDRGVLVAGALPALVPPLLPFQLQIRGLFWKVELGRQDSASGRGQPSTRAPSAGLLAATFLRPSSAGPRCGLRAHLDTCHTAFSPAPSHGHAAVPGPRPSVPEPRDTRPSCTGPSLSLVPARGRQCVPSVVCKSRQPPLNCFSFRISRDLEIKSVSLVTW